MSFSRQAFNESMTARPFPWRTALALLLVAIGIAYHGCVDGELVLDDELSVADNLSIRQLSDLGAVLSPPVNGPTGGRPIANLTFALNYALGGTTVQGYHWGNIALHSAATLLLFGITRRSLNRASVLRGPGTVENASHLAAAVAFAVATIWGLHPALTASVSYISQRTEVLMACFYLLTLYGLIRGAEECSLKWLAASIAACALGMACKEVMVTAPVVALLYDRAFLAGSFGAAWRRRWGYYAALGATWGVLALSMLNGLGQRSVGFGLGVSWWRYALTEAEAVTVYLCRALWPHPLIFDYGSLFASGGITSGLAVILVLSLLVGTAVLLWRRPMLGFLAAAFFIVLAPTSSVVPVVEQPIAENRMYLPMALVAAGLCTGLHAVLRSRGAAVFVLIALAFAGLTLQRSRVYRDGATLWLDTITKRPENGRAYSNYGAILLGRDRGAEALAYLQRAVTLIPNIATAHANYGAALFGAGKVDDSLRHTRRALEINPGLPRARVNLAAALNQKGAYEEALREARRGLELLPGVRDANYQIGNALFRLGRASEAVPHYQEEIKLRPDYAEARSNLGSAFYMLGRPSEAVEQYAAALRQKPDLVEARDNMAAALSQLGRLDEAINLYRTSLQARPNSAVVRTNLAIVLTRAGRLDEAATEFEAALRADSTHAPARAGLEQLKALRRQAR